MEKQQFCTLLVWWANQWRHACAIGCRARSWPWTYSPSGLRRLSRVLLSYTKHLIGPCSHHGVFCPSVFRVVLLFHWPCLCPAPGSISYRVQDGKHDCQIAGKRPTPCNIHVFFDDLFYICGLSFFPVNQFLYSWACKYSGRNQLAANF